MDSSKVTDRQINKNDPDSGAGSAAQKLAAEANSPPAQTKTFLGASLAYAASLVTDNKAAEDNVAEYGSDFLKTAALIMPGRAGLLGTAVLSALDHTHTGQSNSAEATDLALGALSGLATRGAYAMLAKGGSYRDAATTGVAFSLINRTTTALFDKSNYLDSKGQINIATGLGKSMSTALDANGIRADAFIFGGSLYASKLAEEISPIMKTEGMRRFGTGAIFGFTNGVNAELNLEKDRGNYDYLAIAKNGALHAAIDGLAFDAGGLRGSGAHPETENRNGWREESTAAEHQARISVGPFRNLRRIVEADWLRHPSEEPPKPVLGTEVPSELENLSSKKFPNQLAYTPGVEPIEFRTGQAGPFDDYLDFVKRGTVKLPTEVRTYQAGEGSVPIIINEDYATSLDVLRSTPTILSPARQLVLQQRVGPSDVAEALVYLPDRSYFKRVIISDKRNPDDDWVTQDYKDGKEEFYSSMGVLRGEVVLYKKNKDVYFQGDLKHEWSHELHDRHYEEPLAWGFGQSVDLEKQEWSAREYMKRSKQDQFAVMGERLIGTDEKEFLEATEKAPLRTVFYMQALDKALQAVAPENRSVAHDEYARRVEFVKTNVVPLAVQKLDNIIDTGSLHDARTASSVKANMLSEGMIPEPPPLASAEESTPVKVEPESITVTTDAPSGALVH